MRIVLAAVGSPGSGPMSEMISDYQQRAGRYFRFEVREVPAGGTAGRGAGGDDGARPAEARRLVEAVPEELDWFALTREGKGMSSRGLAAHLERMQTYGHPGAAFIVGGAGGLGREVLDRARYRLSLSPMTLPHELARLVMAEQLYRAGTIIAGEPYHRGP